MIPSLYNTLKNTGVITPTEVPDALAAQLMGNGDFDGSVDEIKTCISVLSRVANSSTADEFAAALDRGEFNSVKISDTAMGSVRGATYSAAAQDGCIIKEGTCVPAFS